MQEGFTGDLNERILKEHYEVVEGVALLLSTVQSSEQQRTPTGGSGSSPGARIIQTECLDVASSNPGTQEEELSRTKPNALRKSPGRAVRSFRPILPKASQSSSASEARGARTLDKSIAISNLSPLRSMRKVEEPYQPDETDNSPESSSSRTKSIASFRNFSFRCDCNAVFDDLDSKRRHSEETHMRRYHCLDHCTKSFTTKRSLKRHTKETRCYCPYAACNYPEGFRRREYLKKHLDRKHGLETMSTRIAGSHT